MTEIIILLAALFAAVLGTAFLGFKTVRDEVDAKNIISNFHDAYGDGALLQMWSAGPTLFERFFKKRIAITHEQQSVTVRVHIFVDGDTVLKLSQKGNEYEFYFRTEGAPSIKYAYFKFNTCAKALEFISVLNSNWRIIGSDRYCKYKCFGSRKS